MVSCNEVLAKVISACQKVILDGAQGEACRHNTVFLSTLVLFMCTDSVTGVVHTSLSHTQRNPLLHTIKPLATHNKTLDHTQQNPLLRAAAV